jgi:hypothetical protein
MISFPPKVAVVNSAGDHLRYVPAAKARAMVASGTAAPQASNGRVPAVSLTRPASTYAERVGEPTGRATGVRFYRWVHLEQSASRVVENHPRCFWIGRNFLLVPDVNAAIYGDRGRILLPLRRGKKHIGSHSGAGLRSPPLRRAVRRRHLPSHGEEGREMDSRSRLPRRTGLPMGRRGARRRAWLVL